MSVAGQCFFLFQNSTIPCSVLRIGWCYSQHLLSTSRNSWRRKAFRLSPFALSHRIIPGRERSFILFRLKTPLACVRKHDDQDQEQVSEVNECEHSSSSSTEKTDEELYQAAQRLRVRRERSALRIRAHRPFWTYIIIIINVFVVAIQKLYVMFGHGWLAMSIVPSLQTLGAKVSTKVLSGELWRLLTAAFLHVNIGHLVLNSYALYALGSATEILFGSAAFATLYLGGAVGGNVASVCASVCSSRPSVGSSGGVFALIAAMCIHLERNRDAIGPMARGNLRAVVAATSVNLAGGWLMPSVDGWAHFGGCLYGAVMALCVVPTVVLHRAHDGRLSFVEVRRAGVWACWVVLVIAIAISVTIIAASLQAAPYLLFKRNLIMHIVDSCQQG